MIRDRIIIDVQFNLHNILNNDYHTIASLMAIFPPAVITLVTLWIGFRKAFHSVR